MTARLYLLRRHPPRRIQKNLLKVWIPAFAGMTGLVLSTIIPVWAANSNVGTSGAQFLKIGAGARSTAMGDAFVGVADDVNAVYFNPAGLAQLKRPELTAMHTQWFEGMNYDFGAFAIPLSKGTLALSAATLTASDLEKRNTDESYEGTFDSVDSAYAVSYGFELGELMSVGLTGRYIKQEIDSKSASTWSGDAGLFKRFNNPWSLGFAIRHFGEKVKFENESDPLPLTVVGGVGGHFLKDKLILSLDVMKPRDNDIQYGTGLEYRQSLGKDVRCALRAGTNSGRTDAGESGLSLGAGLGFRQFDLDFAWVPLGDLGNTFRYAAVFRF